MIKKTLKICLLFVVAVHSFAVKEIVFNIDFDEYGRDYLKKYRENIKILIEFNNSKIVDSTEYKIIQDGIEIEDITRNKEVKIVFRKNKIPPTFLVYAWLNNNLIFIDFYDNSRSKIHIKINNKTLMEARIKRVQYEFVDVKLGYTNKYRKKIKKSKKTRNHTCGENPLGEGQTQETDSSNITSTIDH